MAVPAIALRPVESPGSSPFPLERLANEFGVDWGDVMLIAHAVREGGAVPNRNR